MSLNARKAFFRQRTGHRDSNEAPIVKALRDEGYTVVLIDKPVDLIVQNPKTEATALFEVKTPKGTLTPAQKAERERLAFTVVRYPAYAVAAARMLLGALR